MPEISETETLMLLTFPDGRLAVQGSRTRKGQMGWLELNSFAFARAELDGFGRGGMGRAAPPQKSFTTVRPLDKATSQISMLLTNGSRLASVVEFLTDDGTIVRRFTMGGVFVGTVRLGGLDREDKEETAIFTFETLAVS